MRNIGVFEAIFKKPQKEKQVDNYFKMLTGYTPRFTSYDGGVYEMELTRSAIHAVATHASKFLPEINGSAYKELEYVLKNKPNPFMSTSQFLYRTMTILETQNTCYIVPIEDKFGYITGYYPVIPYNSEVLDVGGQPFIRYWFGDGNKATIEFSKVGMLTKFQYQNDFAGEKNTCLDSTMQVINTQNQGIIEGVKSSAFIRFIGKLNNFAKDEDVKKERERFVADNFGSTNNGGVIFYGNNVTDLKQVDSQPFIINAAQQALIQDNVFNYFGVNKEILQNKFDDEKWSAFYEGKLEPFAIQLSLAMSNMTFSKNEISRGNQILFTANRLQYAKNETKLAVSTQLFDRGILTTNQVMDIWNLSHVEDGDKRHIRKEYAEVNNLDGGETNASMQGQGIQSVATDDGTITGKEN